MTPNALSDILAEALGAPNDFVFKRMILTRVNASRAQQLKRSLEKTPQDRKFFTQSIQVAMENYNYLEGTTLTCMHSRSTCPIPKPLRSNSMLYDYVGSVAGDNAYRYTPIGSSKFLNKGTYAKHNNHYHPEGDLLVVETPGIPKVLVVGIFADPEFAFNLDARTRDCGSCDYWESEYPCSEDVLDIIIQDLSGRRQTQPVNLEANGTQNQPSPVT
jgi:hypothetical protein